MNDKIPFLPSDECKTKTLKIVFLYKFIKVHSENESKETETVSKRLQQKHAITLTRDKQENQTGKTEKQTNKQTTKTHKTNKGLNKHKRHFTQICDTRLTNKHANTKNKQLNN